MLTVYGDYRSGNCYKVQWLLHRLDMPHRWIEVDILAGETRTEAFQTRNPNCKIPVIECHDGRMLAESNAILNYLAAGTELIPTDDFRHARMLQWQFFEQHSHEPYIAAARFIAHYLGLPPEREDEYRAKQEGGHRALEVMEATLREQPFLTGESFTLADISLYAYTHIAPEGGFDLDAYPAIQAWLSRVAEQPRHLPMGTPQAR
ncbi:glutathione S-transferase family protein [Halomonas shantousis]